MLARRIIPCLDVKDGVTVKGVKFEDLRTAGDPVELGRRYSELGADELVFLDITASAERRSTFVSVVERVARELSIPFTVGGGISSVDHVDRLLGAGADKVTVNSAALRRPQLIDEIASRFGSQVCVAAIDARFDGTTWRCYVDGGRTPTDRTLLEWADEAQSRGAGEILFTSMDHDGTCSGFALDPLAELSERLHVPLIASGGAGTPEHFYEVFTRGGADAALAAGTFHFGSIAIPQLKRYLASRGITIRL